LIINRITLIANIRFRQFSSRNRRSNGIQSIDKSVHKYRINEILQLVSIQFDWILQAETKYHRSWYVEFCSFKFFKHFISFNLYVNTFIFSSKIQQHIFESR
jgi:hypothetical protein